MRRIGFGAAWLVTLGVAAAVFAGVMGWLTMPQALDFAMGAVALVGLWLVVWLPWDLYFAARGVALDHDDSAERGIDVSERDRASARRLLPRLLATCIALHLVGAAIIASVTYSSHGTVGYYFAGFFVLAMALRPAGAMYLHLRARLEELRERARYPREDVVLLRARVETMEQTIERFERADLPELSAADRRIEELVREHGDNARAREARYEQKVDRVLLELERSMAKLTEDRELLQGIRAFVRVIKQGS
ncbi:MAG: hypothetical protein AB7S26_01020 [Sandaracinaceae bacterium]